MRTLRPIVLILMGVLVGALTGSFLSSAKAQQPSSVRYKVIQIPRDAVSLEASLNSLTSQGWRLSAMDGGLVVLER